MRVFGYAMQHKGGSMDQVQFDRESLGIGIVEMMSGKLAI